MKVILLNDVENLGLSGDIVTVKPGYARNRLIPQGLALRASNKNVAVASERKKVENVKLERENIALKKLAKKLFYCLLGSLGATLLSVITDVGFLFILGMLISACFFLALTAHLLILKQEWTRWSLKNQILDYLIWIGIFALGALIAKILGIF